MIRPDHLTRPPPQCSELTFLQDHSSDHLRNAQKHRNWGSYWNQGQTRNTCRKTKRFLPLNYIHVVKHA